jgi:ABC-2 type transport system ATP-binding protein
MAVQDPRATSTADIVVELSGVDKTYQQAQRSPHLRDLLTNLLRPRRRLVHALRGVDLTVRRGEVVAYAGPNGAGKSTTIKLLSGLLAPDRGQVRALGMDPVRDRVRYVGRVGVVFGQRTELWWDHPVEATFEWKRVVWDIPDERYQRMRELVRELLGLDDLLRSLARELSLGQRMRADLGLALLHEPDLLLLDEPTLGLDVLARRSMLEVVRRLNRERQMTVVVTSHDMAELEQLAGRIVLLHQGQIAFDGDFSRLRRMVTPGRVLILETADPRPPALQEARLIGSQGARHEYEFDSSRVSLPSLLEDAARQSTIVDVETHRPPIDQVVAELYGQWLANGARRDDHRPP